MRWLLPAVLLAAGVLPVQGDLASRAAQERSAILDASTPHDRLFAVHFEDDRGLAVGESGLIKASADAGASWVKQDTPTDLAIIALSGNGRRTIAVGQMGLVLVREGDGPWKKVASGTQRRLLGVDLNRGGMAVAVGAFGTLIKSVDGGETWTDIAPDWALLYDAGSGDLAAVRDEPTNYIVEVRDDGRILIGGEYGQLMSSPDGGGCWDVVYRHPSEGGQSAPTLFSLDLRDDGMGFAVGQSGLVLRTENGGNSWRVLPTPVEAGLFAVESSADGHVAIVGQRAGLRSTDHGQTWTTIRSLDLTLNWYSGLARPASAPAGDFVAVGHGGRILRLRP